jgi:lipid-A-disaccharide synthase
MPKTVMIITGESSGELYGALLARAIKGIWPDARVLGVGGKRMAQAGVEVFAGIAGAFGLTEAIASYKEVKDTFRKTVDMLRTVSPDVAVLIDYPDFNFKVAGAAGKLGIPVLYYVSPQVWAWRKKRVKTMARIAQRIAVVLPFEEEIYRDEPIRCEFVGHPVMDEIDSLPEDRGTLKEMLGLDPERPALALLPGSRTSELKRLLPVVLQTVRRIKEEFPEYELVLPLAPNLDTGRYGPFMDEFSRQGVKVVKEKALHALSASEAAIIASGTATLQAAFLERPMVVIYKVFPLTYFLGRMILDVKYITLVNLILDRPVVPEIIQGRATTERIMNELRLILNNEKHRAETLSGLRTVREMFSGKRPSRRVAEIVGEMAGWGVTDPTSQGHKPLEKGLIEVENGKSS